jgi:hypothetical protein
MKCCPEDLLFGRLGMCFLHRPNEMLGVMSERVSFRIVSLNSLRSLSFIVAVLMPVVRTVRGLRRDGKSTRAKIGTPSDGSLTAHQTLATNAANFVMSSWVEQQGAAVAFSSFDTLEPSDLRLVRGLLEEVCAERSVALDHPDAAIIARELVNWYLFGVRHPGQLKVMLESL